MPTMTPNEVASRSGISRRTVMRAITKGLLVAKRTNDGWLIEEKDFDTWASAHEPPTNQRMRVEDPLPILAPNPETAVLEERIRGLEALMVEMGKRADAANQRCDEWKVQAEYWKTLAERPWWKRLAG